MHRKSYTVCLLPIIFQFVNPTHRNIIYLVLFRVHKENWELCVNVSLFWWLETVNEMWLLSQLSLLVIFVCFWCLFVCSFFLFYLWGCEVMCQWFNWICGGVGFLRSGVFPFQNRDITCCLFKLSLEWSLDFQGKVILVLCSRTWMANFFYLTFTFARVIDFFCWETSLHEI